MAENDLLTRLLDAGMTFTALTQARAEELIRDLVRAGAVQAEQAQDGVDELLARSRRNSERVIEAVRSEIDDQLAKLDLATRDDLERMVHRFADVASTIVAQVAPDRARTSSSTASPSPEATSPAAVPAASTTGSSATKAPARKSTARKSPATKASAEKAAAKKSTAKKAPAKKSTAKKSTAKKSTAKKSTAKKAPAKKAPAKKAPAKKSTAKKSPAKKSTAAKKSPGTTTTSG